MKKLCNLLPLMAVIILTACTKDKPEEPPKEPDGWKDETSVSAYCDTFYDSFTGYGDGTGKGDFYFKTLTDDQVADDIADWTFTDVPLTSSLWNSEWQQVRRANLLLEKIGDVPIPEVRKTHWTAIGRLMRGWHYYRLVRMYGNLPWVENSADISEEGYVLSGNRNDRDAVMDKVLSDINYACTNADENNSKTTLNRAAANAMKAEVCLYEGTFRKYRVTADGQKAPDTEGAVRFLKGVKEAYTYITGRGYRLNDSYQGNYNSTDLSTNPEMILYKEYGQDGKRHSLIAATSSSVPLCGMSRDAFETYLYREDGKPVTLTAENNSDLPEEIADASGKSTYSIRKILELHDARLMQTIDTALCYAGRIFVRFNNGLPMTSSTGYGICKYDNPAIPAGERNVPGKNHTDAPLFWLSVVYLQYAEACAELDNLGAATISENDLDGLNKLRTRAQLPDLNINPGFSDPKNTFGIGDLIWEIRRERRCELMFDNDTRYWDLVRWHMLVKLDTGNYPSSAQGANLSTDKEISGNSQVSTTGDGYMDCGKERQRKYDKKYYLYPIPSDQLTRTTSLEPNNPGWQ